MNFLNVSIGAAMGKTGNIHNSSKSEEGMETKNGEIILLVLFHREETK